MELFESKELKQWKFYSEDS